MIPVLDYCPLTLNTTRICASNAVTTAASVSKIGFTNMQPNAVILVNKAEVYDAITASALVHFPINAALLLTDARSLSRETLEEIRRLSPKGYNGIQVILVGNLSRNITEALRSYGLSTMHITGRNHYETACKIPAARKEFKNILIISGEDYTEGIMTPYWSAHHGDPILFVQKNGIPSCTLEAIKKMEDINIYIIASEKTVANTVETALSSLSNVKTLKRISGSNPYEIAINFAKYKDAETEFGWGRNYREGHAFTFGTLEHPMEAAAGALFAHMGKHTPFLIIGNNFVPETVESYVKSVKPIPPKDMPRPPFMHGFILGDTTQITYAAQVKLEEMLSIEHEMNPMRTTHNFSMVSFEEIKE